MIKHATNWMSKNCRFAQIVIREPEKEETKQDYVQWMTSNEKSYFPASQNVKVLKPGFYEVCQTMNGLFFQRLAIGSEGLIEFPETNSNKVIDEIEKFWDTENKFKELKTAFKRGILLYGPPGSGKTCTIKIVIQNLIKRGGVVIRFDSPSAFEAGMKILREIQPATPVVALMEDVDAILSRYCESDVLNILDGVIPMEKVVFLATTNYPERLGSRIMNRPSRFDKRFEIGMPNDETRRIYLKGKVGSKISAKELEKWVKDTSGLSIAHLKELIVAVLILEDDYKEAIQTLTNMKVKIGSEEFDPYGKDVFLG